MLHAAKIPSLRYGAKKGGDTKCDFLLTSFGSHRTVKYCNLLLVAKESYRQGYRELTPYGLSQLSPVFTADIQTWSLTLTSVYCCVNSMCIIYASLEQTPFGIITSAKVFFLNIFMQVFFVVVVVHITLHHSNPVEKKPSDLCVLLFSLILFFFLPFFLHEVKCKQL